MDNQLAKHCTVDFGTPGVCGREAYDLFFWAISKQMNATAPTINFTPGGPWAFQVKRNQQYLSLND
jgi:hypothetical protein